MGGARPAIYTDVAAHGETSASAAPLAFLQRLNAYLSFQDVKPMISSLRTAKDAGEVALIRKAVDASVAAKWHLRDEEFVDQAGWVFDDYLVR